MTLNFGSRKKRITGSAINHYPLKRQIWKALEIRRLKLLAETRFHKESHSIHMRRSSLFILKIDQAESHFQKKKNQTKNSDLYEEQLAEISSSTNTDPFATSGDSSYMPSCTEVSSCNCFAYLHVVIRGKRGRGVPVLFTEDVQENIEVMLQYRQNFVHKENLFLFVKANSRSEICKYNVLSKYAKMCGAKNPTSITSTRLRKHLATLQIFCMSDNDIEQLATFIGHTPGVHRGSYRLPADVYQAAKLSKLLLLMEKGEAGHYQGKSLQEFNLNMEENLLDETKDNDSDVDNDMDLIEAENLVEVQMNKEMEKTIVVQETRLQKKNKRRILIRWTAELKRIAKNFFQTHIKSSYPPKKNECESLIT